MTATTQIQRLHTAAIDAKNGYEEALKEAEGGGLSGLFDKMAGLHRAHADQLADELRRAGESADDGGSIMSKVHSVIMDLRALVGGLDSSVLPGLIDGEKRTIAKYDEVLASGELTGAMTTLISQQRLDLCAAVSRMQAKADAEDAHSVL